MIYMISYDFSTSFWDSEWMICFYDFILNAQWNSNCIRISLIYIWPISPDFSQRISRKNALVILSSQVIILHEEHFKPIELWSYITEVLQTKKPCIFAYFWDIKTLYYNETLL